MGERETLADDRLFPIEEHERLSASDHVRTGDARRQTEDGDGGTARPFSECE